MPRLSLDDIHDLSGLRHEPDRVRGTENGRSADHRRHGHERYREGQRRGCGRVRRPRPRWVGLDRDGNPTTDPQAALDGMMAPLGGAKGYGLALMVDLLAGGLTGSNFSHESSSFGDNEGGPPGVGQLFVAFAPARFSPQQADSSPTAGFESRVDRLADVIRAQPGTRLPGERRHRFRLDAQDDGVEVPEELIGRLEGYC